MAAVAAAGGSMTLSADSVRRWSTADVAAWLQSVRLEAHASVFEANHINGQVILDVDKNALKQMGIATVGDRVRLDKAIRDLKRATNTGAGAGAGAGGSQPVSATNSVISSAGSASGFQRPIAVSHSADQLGIHRTASSSGMGPGSGPVRQASTGLLVNHHQQAQYQLYAYNQQQQQQQQQSMMSAQHYHSSPYSSSSLTLPYSTASGAASSYSLSPSGGHPLPPLPADAHTTPSQSRPSTGASAGAPPPLADGTSSRPSTSGGSVSNMGVPASSATLGLGSSSSSSSSASTGPNAFSQRRSAHQRPPPLQLAHSANYALANPNLPPGGSSSTLAPSSIPGAASSPYRARSSSGTSASALGVPGSGNPLTHSLFVNGQPHPNQNAGSIHSHLTPGQQQAAAQATPTGPPPTTIIGTGWTAHPAQGPSVSGQASSSSAASSSARLPSPTYPNNPNPNIQYTMHRKQLSSSQLTAASSGSRTRTAAAEYTSSMQTVGPGVRNHNASSYVKKGYAPPGSSGGRPDKNAGLYAHQAGGHPAYGGYYGAAGGGSGHAHHLSTSSNSSTSAGSAQPGVASTATSPIAAVFTPSTVRPGGVYGGSDESGLEGGNSPYSRTPTTPSYPGSVSQAMEHGGPSHAIPIQSNAMDPRLRSVYQPVGIGGSSLSNANMYTPEDVTRRKLKFHCEDLGSTHKVLVSDCQDAYDVLARVLRTFGIRGGTGINAYPPYHGQSMNDPESDEDDDGNQYGIAIESDDTWAIFASSPDGKTKMLSDNELIAVCHAPQPHDPLRERGLHLRRIGANNSKFQQTRRNNKLNKFFGESEIPEAGSAAAGAGNGQGQVSPGPGRGAGRDYESESYENIAPLSSNANRKPKMNRASTISFMSGLGLGAGRNSASAEREQMMLQHQQNMALQQFREQHSAQIVQVPPHAHATAAMYAMPGAPAQAAFSNEISAPLQPPPMPSSAAAAATAAAAAAATATASTAQINPSTSGSSMLGLLPRRARHLFGHRPPSELISSNLQDYFPATEKKVLERTARRSVYGKASVRSKRDSTWSFKPPDWIADIGDEEGEPVPIRRSGESYEFRKGYDGADADSMQEHIKLEVGSNGEEVERIQVQRAHSNASSRSGTSSNPERNPRARSGKSGPPTLPPVVGRNSLDDWAASLQTAASPVEEYPRGSKVGPSSFDSMPETPTAIPRGISNARDDGSLLAPNAASRKDNASTSPSIGSSPLPSSSSQTLSSSMHLHRPRSVRRNSGESSRSRRSFARFQQYGHTGDRDRSDAASLLTVDEITQDIESRNENAHFLATSGADWLGATIAVGGVIDADGNPVPTRMSMTGRWTGGGDADSISIRSKKPTILLTDDDRSSINARSMRSLKRNKSSASRRKAIPSVSATGSGRSSATEDQKDVGGSTTLHTAEEGPSASPSVGTAPQEEEDEEDDTFDEEDEDFDEGDELDEEEEPDEAEEITHPAHRAGKARRKWIKGALIGAGSFGSVFLGMDQRTGLYMAVKQVELPTGKSDNEQRKMSMLEALEREIALLKTFEHPNIVQYLDSYADDSHLNIFLEYVPGGSVVAILRDWGTFQEPLVQAFITQTLLGLQFLHGREIIHSDIKGANILVDTKGQIKISDFGISKKDAEVIASSSKAPKKTALQGSVFWMAPEAVKQTSSSRKADIWSVGCLVVEMLTGMHPWPSLNQMQALFRIGSMKATPPMPEDISENCRHFLNWTFELDHTKRPTADDLLAHKFLMEVAQLEPDVPMGGTEDDNDGDDTVVTGASSSRVLTVNSTNTVGSVASGRKGKGKRKGGGGGGVNAGAAGTSAVGLAALAAD